MLVLFFIILIGVAVMSVFFFSQARKMERRQLPGGGPPGLGGQPNRLLTTDGERNALNMQVKDIVSHYGDDYEVEGRLDYWDEGDTWISYMLVDGDTTRWLSAEDDDRLELSLWEEVEDLHISDTPPEREIQYMGLTFFMSGAGTARVSRQGRTGAKSALSVDYFDYKSDGAEMLSVENWGNSIEVSLGRAIDPIDLEILPGDQVDY